MSDPHAPQTSQPIQNPDVSPSMAVSLNEGSIPEILHGYAYTTWPDLSADRSPPNSLHVSTKKIPKVEWPGGNFVSLLLSGIARTLGAYCGISDVLVVLQDRQDESIGLVRVTWDLETKWDELIASVSSSIHEAVNYKTTVPSIRNALSLNHNQSPSMVIFKLDQHALTIEQDCPAVFSYYASESVLRLSTASVTIHPDVANQILSQVSGFVEYASREPRSKIALTPALPLHLMSIWERRDEDGIKSAYPHIPTVRFATDYLSLRAQDMPNVTAVRWYPELSLDPSLSDFESISYSEFHKKANQVARWLIRLGLQQEDRVAVCLERNIYFHTAMMGVMRAGGCYVPIDPELPLERKAYIAKDATAAFVLTSSKTTSPDLFGSKTLYIEDELAQAEISLECEDDIMNMTEDGLSYLLYTSGTTGNPKGCLLTHRGLAQAILALSSTSADVRMDNARDGHYLAVASIAFDVHLAESFVPLALGMPLLSARRSQLLENLPAYVKLFGITHLGIVPSLIEATLNAAEEGVAGADIALRYIASGGEKMSDVILDKWADHPQVRLANFYGPSEVTIGCCARFMTPATPKSNIGQPLANVSAYVVDSEMNILCRGAVGELVVEGPLVGRGYHGRPDLTQKVFLEWPRVGCWAYRTGDLVRMMPDSTIEILGRIDTQIKLRGVRIESEGISAIVRKAAPSENNFALEATTILAKHPAIGADQLVSLFSWDRNVTIAVRKSVRPGIAVPPPGLLKDIKRRCEAELAAYMRPSHLIPLNWLPLNSNGKTDVKLLLELFINLEVNLLAELSMTREEDDSRACSDLETRVFDVLRTHVTMPLGNPHPDTTVFECGLDSMAIIRFTTDLRAVFHSKITASDIMKGPRISDIASHLEESAKAAGGLDVLSFDIHDRTWDEIYSDYGRDRVDAVLPPFTVQEGVLARSTDVDTLYVQHVILSCKKGTSLEALRGSWNATMHRHQILRTVFHFSRSLHQVVLAPEHCELNWTEKERSFINDSTFVDHFLGEEATTISREINHNLTSLPPYRLSVLSSIQTTYLVFSIHHALFDGISLPLILQAVERDYQNVELGPAIPSKDILQLACNIDLGQAHAFWDRHFAGFLWPIPTFKQRRSDSVKKLVVPFNAPLSSFKATSMVHRVTMQALFTAAFGAFLAKDLYHQRDVVFGVVRSGRLLPLPNIDEALCPLVTILPMRVNLSKPPTVLQDVQYSIASMVEFEHVPLGKVQSWVRQGHTLFEVLFSVSVDSTQESELWEIVESKPPEPDYPLAVEIVLNPANDSLLIQAAWLDEDFTPTIQACLHAFERSLNAISDDPTTYFKHSAFTISPIISHVDENPSLDSDSTSYNCATADPIVVAELQTVVAEFLDINPTILTPSMSFIAMGLDSIKSVGLAKALSRRGLVVTSTAILRHSTLAKLAAHIGDLKLNTTEEGSNKTLVEDVEGSLDLEKLKLSKEDEVMVFPTTALQAGLLSQTIGSEGRLYVHAFPLRLSADMDLERMRGAWTTVVQAVATLRTTFHFLAEVGKWVQVVHKDNDLKWTQVSVRPDETFEQATREFLSTIKLDHESSFQRPPFFIRIFDLGHNDGVAERELYLTFVMHHSLYDGVSVGKLLAAVEDIYCGRPFEYLTQFHDLLHHFVKQEKEGTSFWTKRLQTIRSARLSCRYPSLASASALSLVKHVALDGVRVKDLIRRAAVTPQCIGQAAWAMTMAKLTGYQDVVFGHTISGRNIIGAEDVIGPVINTLPCIVRLGKSMKYIDLLRFIHQANLDSLPWQQASLRAIQKVLKVDSLWDSLFLFQHSEDAEAELNSIWHFEEYATEEGIDIQYPLAVEMLFSQSSIELKCAALPTFLQQHDLLELLNDLQQFIEVIVNEPNGSACDWLRNLADEGAQAFDSEGDISILGGLHFNEDLASSIETSPYLSILQSVTNAPAVLLQQGTPLIALGIDSITAIQIAGKFRQASLKLAASDVLSSRTVGEMLRKVKPARDVLPAENRQTPREVNHDEQAAIAALFEGSDDVETVSAASAGMMWLIGAWQKSCRTRFQHVFAYRLPETIHVSKLKQAWLSLVRRHPILRSTFASAGSQQDPRIVTFSAEVEPLWSEEYIENDACLESAVAKMQSLVSNPLSTLKPPTQVVLFGSNRERFLILHLHHFQYDAWSLQLLIHDLSCLYWETESKVSNNMSAFLDLYAGNPIHLPLQQEYWQKTFPAGFAPQLFPVLRSRNSITGATERTIRTEPCWIANASRCHERAQELGLSLQCVFLSSWSRIHGEMTGTSSATFGLWHSGRTGALDDIENLAVPCVNVLPMYVGALDGLDTLAVAHSIQSDLQKRTSEIEQSDLVRVAEWVGAVGPMCNVFINIVKVVSDIGTEDTIFRPVEAPYFVPSHVTMEQETNLGKLAISEVFKDDIMFDIATLSETDRILISIDAAAYMMDEGQADALILRWSHEVKKTLGLL